MSIRLDNVTAGVLTQFSAEAPDGAFIGLIGGSGSGVTELLQLVGEQSFSCPNLSAVDLDFRLEWLSQAELLRRKGITILAASADPEMLRNLVDEIWWLEGGKLIQRGDPGETITAYNAKVIRNLRAKLAPGDLHPSLRRGDGRARVVSVEVLDANLAPVALLQSGQAAAIRVKVLFLAAVADPVVGVMIRTRIGFEVYGTNTELEKLKLGPVLEGETRTVTFHFDCRLCAQSYSVTAASHDPNGVWHEWLEDAISFAVADTRYTAGVANLHARAELS